MLVVDSGPPHFMDYHDDDEVVPTSDTEEQNEIDMRLTLPPTLTYSHALGEHVPAKKRARTPAATAGHFSPVSSSTQVWSRAKTPAYSPPPPPSPPQLPHNSSPYASQVPVIKSEEDSDDSLDMIFGYHGPETSSQPAPGTSSSPRLHSIPPPSMTPVSDRGNSQRETTFSQEFPMDIDDGWERPPPALTPDADDLMDFGDSERPTTPPLPERTSPIRQESPLSSAPPSPQAPAPTNNVDPAAPFPDIPPESRYSLRTRKPQQKNPYLYDQVNYKLLMKNNPEAIVKMREVEREVRRRNDDQYEQGTQDPEPDEYEHRHRTSHSRSKSRHQSEGLPEGLEALPDFDAEDRAINKDVRDAKKELAKIKRRRELEKEEEEKRRHQEQEEAEIMEESQQRAATPPSFNDSFRELSISPQKGTPRLARSGSRTVISPTPSPVRHSRSPSRVPSPEQDMDIDGFNFDSPLGSRASSPIIVEEAHGSSVESDSAQSQSESEEEGFENDAGVKVLSRMYPAFMIKDILNDGSKKKRSAATGGTRPSQKGTKRRRSRSVTKIVGDPESSDEDRRPEQQVDPDDDLVAFGEPGPGPSTLSNSSRVKSERDVIDISTDEEEDYPRHTHYISDDDSTSSPEPENTRKWALFGKEPDAIDYMLVRPVRSEAKRRSRSHHSSKATGKSRRPAGKGKGREIQTKLTDWGGHGRSIRSDGKKMKKGNMESSDEDEPENRTTYSKLTDKERARRELKRRRKEQKAKNGVYTITAPKGARITTGQRRHPHSADLEVEDAVTAPTAKEQTVFHYAPRPAPPRRAGKDPRREEPLQPAHNNEREASPMKLKPPEVDVKKLTFGSNTFIGKGWLFELMENSAAEPVIISVSGISFSGEMTSQEFLDSLTALWRILFEAIAGLPDSDNDVVIQSCTRLCRAASLILSYLLRTLSPEEADDLRTGVECQIRQLLQKVQTPEFEQEAGDHTIWTLLWSAVELGIRIGLTVSAKSEEANLLVSFADILIARLVRHGLAEAVGSVQSDVVETPLHPIELWVCLFHVLRPASKDDGHIVWSCVETAIKAQGPGDLPPRQMSDRLWFIIRALADLSQFSVHGRYSPEGVPYQGWNVVLLALNAASLLPAETRGKRARDEYAASVVENCAQMCHEAKWPMKAAFPVLMRLTSIFVSRGFVSLAHEGRDYPQFALDNEWDKFKEPGPKDSAYVTFLKLLLRALPSLKTMEQKKLLTQSISRSKFAFSKSEPPSMKDLSGLTNRFVGILAAIYASPDGDHVRIEQANQYVDFKSSDDNTRWIAIQGFQLLCQVLVFRRRSLEGVLKWLETIVDALLEDCGTRAKEGPYNVRLLIRSIAYVYSTIASVNNQGIFTYERPCYPNSAILSQIQRIARNSSLGRKEIPHEVQVTIQAEVVRTYYAFFRARSTAVPSPTKPVVNAANEESQDSAFDGFDDFDDSVLRVAADYEEQDKATSKLLQAHSWYILRFCTSCNSDRKLAEEENLWMETWVNCCALLVRCSSNAKGDSWATYWKSYIDKLSDRSETGQKKAQTRLLRHVLKADPDVYTTPGFMNTVQEVAFESLAAKEITTDHTGLLAEVLNVDQAQAQQLFPVVPFPKKDMAYDVIISDFEELCPDLIDGVFTFVEEQLTRHNTMAVTQPIHLVTKLFSQMRAVCNEQAGSAETDESTRYVAYCNRILEKFRQHEQLRADSRLKFWVDWLPK